MLRTTFLKGSLIFYKICIRALVCRTHNQKIFCERRLYGFLWRLRSNKNHWQMSCATNWLLPEHLLVFLSYLDRTKLEFSDTLGVSEHYLCIHVKTDECVKWAQEISKEGDSSDRTLKVMMFIALYLDFLLTEVSMTDISPTNIPSLEYFAGRYCMTKNFWLEVCSGQIADVSFTDREIVHNRVAEGH